MASTNINISSAKSVKIASHYYFPHAVPIPMRPCGQGRNISPEARGIIKRFRTAHTTAAIQEMVWEVFFEHFWDEIKVGSGTSRDRNTGFDVWKRYCK